jgi:hypothetical protein
MNAHLQHLLTTLAWGGMASLLVLIGLVLFTDAGSEFLEAPRRYRYSILLFVVAYVAWSGWYLSV